MLLMHCRIHRGREAGPGPGHTVRGVQEQKMGVQLDGERAGTDHVQVPGPVRGAEEVAHCQGGLVPVPQHVPVCECVLIGECDPRLPAHCRGAHRVCQGAVTAGSDRHR